MHGAAAARPGPRRRAPQFPPDALPPRRHGAAADGLALGLPARPDELDHHERIAGLQRLLVREGCDGRIGSRLLSPRRRSHPRVRHEHDRRVRVRRVEGGDVRGSVGGVARPRRVTGDVGMRGAQARLKMRIDTERRAPPCPVPHREVEHDDREILREVVREGRVVVRVPFVEGHAERVPAVCPGLGAYAVGPPVHPDRHTERPRLAPLPVVRAEVDAVGDGVVEADPGGHRPAVVELHTGVRPAHLDLPSLSIERDAEGVGREMILRQHGSAEPRQHADDRAPAHGGAERVRHAFGAATAAVRTASSAWTNSSSAMRAPKTRLSAAAYGMIRSPPSR